MALLNNCCDWNRFVQEIALDVALGDLSKRSRSKGEILWTQKHHQHHGVPAQYFRYLWSAKWGNGGKLETKKSPRGAQEEPKRSPRGDQGETKGRPRGDQEETKRRPRGDQEETKRRPRGDQEETKGRPRIREQRYAR